MTEEGTGTLPAAVTKAYDVLLWLITHVGKFPRSHRFVLGDRIESRMLSVLESLVLAAYARANVSPINLIDARSHRLIERAGVDRFESCVGLISGQRGVFLIHSSPYQACLVVGVLS